MPPQVSDEYPLLKKIYSNIGWLLVDKVSRVAVGLLVTIWLARYLGPGQFGQLNFLVALVAVFGVFATLGLRGIVVRDLLAQPEKSSTILGTAFALRIGAAALVYILLIGYGLITRPDDALLMSLIVILGFSIIFRSAEVITFWFESQVRSKYVVWVENSIFTIGSVIKLIMIWQQASLISFVWILLLESVAVSAGLLFVYSKVASTPFDWTASKDEAKSLLQDSWPLIISSAAWMIYTRIDQVMIGEMLDDQAVGYYSVAIKMADAANFLPAIIAFSLIPAITLLRESNRARYEHQFQMTYDTVVGVMLVVAIFTTFLSGPIINTLFGTQYEAAASVLGIYIWSSVFIAMAVVSGKYLINEGLQKVTMQRHITGVLINIPLNFLVIPVYGIEGAAFASLFSLAFANYFFDAITRDTRLCFIQKTRAFFAYGLIQNLMHKRLQ